MIKIYDDEDAENLQVWDNLTTLFCGHSRHQLCDNHVFYGGREFLLDLCDLNEECALSGDELAARAEKHAVLLSLISTIILVYIKEFLCPWDSGQGLASSM